MDDARKPLPQNDWASKLLEDASFDETDGDVESVFGPLKEQYEHMRRIVASISQRLNETAKMLPRPVDASGRRDPKLQLNPALEALQRIRTRFDAERAEKDDSRHSVMLIVKLFDETRLFNVSMSHDGKNRIWIRGTDVATQAEREVTVPPDELEVEFVTLEKSPPELRISA